MLEEKPIFLLVTILGAKNIAQHEVREAAIVAALQPFGEAGYNITDLEGERDGEYWVLLLRNDHMGAH